MSPPRRRPSRARRKALASSACLSAWLIAACGGNDATTPLDAGMRDAASPGDASAGDEDSGAADAATRAEPTASPLCSTDGFCWSRPAPQGETLRAAWAASPDDVWLVGDHGSLLHYDGASFTSHNLPEHTGLRAVHGSAADDVWAVGDDGHVFHYDGQSWRSQDVSELIGGGVEPSAGGLYGIFAAAPDAVWAVGTSGVSALVLFYDGERWQNQLDAPLSQQTLRAVWGVSAARAWAVGDKGVILSFDGTSWQLDKSPTQAALRSVHALDEREVWAVGDGGVALRWDGTAWKGFNKGLSGALYHVNVNLRPPPMATDAGTAGTGSMMGTAGMEAPAAGSGGSGAAAPQAPAGPWLVYAFGEKGHVFRYNGELWAQLPSGSDVAFFGAARLAQDALIAVGEHGQTTRFMGDGRVSLSSGSFKNHLGMFAADATLWTVGDSITKHTSEGWIDMPRPNDRALYGVWAGADAVWAVGTAGNVLRLQTDAFEEVTVAAAGETWLRAVYGAAGSLWIVGDGGLALTAAAGGFVKVPTPVRTTLQDVWGDADDDFWAVGDAGVVLRWDGASWLKVPIAPMDSSTQTLRAIWGSSADDIWVVGTESSLLHWDGERFESMSPGESYTLNDVWGRSAEDVYVVGSAGVVLHYDGTDWQPLDSGTSRGLQAISGDARRIFVAGLDGALLVRETESLTR